MDVLPAFAAPAENSQAFDLSSREPFQQNYGLASKWTREDIWMAKYVVHGEGRGREVPE